MGNRISLNKASVIGIVVLVVLLACVRLYQQELFYDPFVQFFKTKNYKGQPLPLYDSLKLGLNLLLRYTINTLISLAIIWLLFRDRSVIRLSLLLYALFFIVLLSLYYIVLNSNDPDMLLLFYIRRFLIQPLFLLLFVPAFYYQNKAK